MGVTGLWKLIEPCGKPVPVETLEGKILAIDISIWLHQVVKGFQDSKGSALAHAHLLGLFHRLCKLLYYRVRPVFVFDGCVPQLKRDTIARRNLQRSKLNTEAERIQNLLLESLAKEKVVQQALGVNAELLLKSPTKRVTKPSRADTRDDMFKLPELPSGSSVKKNNRSESDSNDISNLSDDYTFDGSTDDSSFEDSNARHTYNVNLQAIDVRSRHFRELPADVRHEILVDIKETRKQSSWGRLHELPSHSDDFSAFQMKRLLKRRAVQESLEEAEQEMGGRTLTYAELKNFFTEEGIVASSELEKGTKQISSDEHTRFLLVRDLKKKLKAVEEVEEKKPKLELEEDLTVKEEIIIKENIKIERPTEPIKLIEDEQPSTSTKALGNEYDVDLQLAIAMSLEETQVYNEKDYEYKENENLKLNKAQSKNLRNAAVGPARTYMIEYGGMNVDEVQDIMEKTQLNTNGELEIGDFSFLRDLDKADDENKTELLMPEELSLRVTDDEGNTTDSEGVVRKNTNKQSKIVYDAEELCLRVSSSSDSESDFEEVEPIEPPADKKDIDLDVPLASKKRLEIVVDLTTSEELKDDIFADIFEAQPIDEKFSESEKVKETPPENLELVQELQSSEDSIKLVSVDQHKPEKNIKTLLIDELEEIGQKTNKKPAASLASILADLQKQKEDINMLNLDTIKIKETSVDATSKSEIIEIYDSEDFHKLPTPNSLAVSPRKSPNSKTPTKNKAITEFFQTNYVIKRTPDKKTDEATSKVKSPFFVRKTPKSADKRDAETDSAESSPEKFKNKPKAAKTLFENEITLDDVKELEEEKAEKETEVQKVQSTEDIIREAAEVLKEQKTETELRELATDLARQRYDLESERNRQDRMGMTISQRMNSECQELLRLFGIPYIIAPMEAEAQCAFLDAMELTNGTITDDSDIWLFGGRTVYKNFFQQNKHVLEFCAEKIEKLFSCDRKKLIQLACLVGSDYTTGINGIGAVTALEIIASFSSSKSEDLKAVQASHSGIATILQTLQKFRDWWEMHNSAIKPPGSTTRMALRKKLKNIELSDGFPSIAVVEAYLMPKVDESKETFSWGLPDVESIREFTRKTFGWTTSKTDDILMPVMKKINDKKSQATIRNYFTVKSAVSTRDLKVSKRVKKAIDRLEGKIETETPERIEKERKTKRGRPKKNNEVSEPNEVGEEVKAKRGRPKKVKKVDADTEEQQVGKESDEQKEEQITLNAKKVKQSPATQTKPKDESTASSQILSKAKRKVNIPNTKQVIPQREKTLEQMRKNKELAAKILKNETSIKKSRKP